MALIEDQNSEIKYHSDGDMEQFMDKVNKQDTKRYKQQKEVTDNLKQQGLSYEQSLQKNNWDIWKTGWTAGEDVDSNGADHQQIWTGVRLYHVSTQSTLCTHTNSQYCATCTLHNGTPTKLNIHTLPTNATNAKPTAPNDAIDSTLL